MTPAATGDRSLTRGLSMARVLGSAWPALLLATVCLLPFLNKAFLVDDPHFLAMARQIVKHPLHPMDYVLCWNLSDNCTKAYALTPGNALMGYALVPTVLSGASEWTAHITQLVFGWIAVVAMCSFILRLGWNRGHAMAGALLLVAIPPFLPMASSAMPDILATAVGLVAMERLAAWKAEGKWQQGAAAAVALGLAGFARAHLALLLPLGAFFLLASPSPRKILAQIRKNPWLWTPVLAGALLLLAVIAATRERSLLLDPPPVFTGLSYIPRNLLSYLLYFAFPLPLAACWVANRWKVAPLRLGTILPAAIPVGLMVERYPYLNLIGTLLAIVSLAALSDLLLEAYQKQDQEGLFLLLWLLIPLPVVYYGHLPIKYLLPSVPALILMCLRLSANVPVRIALAASIFLMVAGVGYSLLILRSDAEFAEFGRSAMTRLIRPHAAAGQNVWFGGHFSAYWYAPLAGAKLSVPGSVPPKPGDLVVVGLYEGGAVTLKRFPNRILVETVSHTYRFGRTMGNGIGLYSNYFGPWLWGFGNWDQDRYELWRITDAKTVDDSVQFRPDQ
jgi:hypothetical protein